MSAPKRRVRVRRWASNFDGSVRNTSTVTGSESGVALPSGGLVEGRASKRCEPTATATPKCGGMSIDR
jgi:hypothetical protein